MHEITNFEDAMISGILYAVAHIWDTVIMGVIAKSIRGWSKMVAKGRGLAWNAGGCVKSLVPAVVYDRM